MNIVEQQNAFAAGLEAAAGCTADCSGAFLLAAVLDALAASFWPVPVGRERFFAVVTGSGGAVVAAALGAPLPFLALAPSPFLGVRPHLPKVRTGAAASMD